MSFYYYLLVSFHIVIIFVFCYHILGTIHKPRKNPPTYWAKKISSSTLENLYQVNPYLFRSAEPTEKSFQKISILGIKKIIVLYPKKKQKYFFSGIEYYYFPMKSHKPNKESIEKALFEIKKSLDNNIPTLIHCFHGADRTGLVIACHRIFHEHWKKEEAIAEMLEGGYGFHSLWSESINFIKKL